MGGGALGLQPVGELETRFRLFRADDDNSDAVDLAVLGSLEELP